MSPFLRNWLAMIAADLALGRRDEASDASIDAPQGSVLLRIGDDVDMREGASIVAMSVITVRGDVDDRELPDADPGVGVNIDIFGDLAAEDIFVFGRDDRV